MGIGDALLGTESSAEFKQMKTKTPEQEKAINELVSLLSGEVSGFETKPALTSREESFQNTLDQMFGQLSNIMGFDQANIDELFRTTIQDPLVKNVREDIIPGLSARYGNQFFSSERQRAEQGAIDELVSTLAGEKAKLVQGERQRQLQALGLLPATAEAGFTFGDVGEAKRRQAGDERLKLINALLGSTGQNTFENVGVVKPGTEGALSGFLGGVGTGFGKSLGKGLF